MSKLKYNGSYLLLTVNFKNTVSECYVTFMPVVPHTDPLRGFYASKINWQQQQPPSKFITAPCLGTLVKSLWYPSKHNFSKLGIVTFGLSHFSLLSKTFCPKWTRRAVLAHFSSQSNPAQQIPLTNVKLSFSPAQTLCKTLQWKPPSLRPDVG